MASFVCACARVREILILSYLFSQKKDFPGGLVYKPVPISFPTIRTQCLALHWQPTIFTSYGGNFYLT